MTAEEAPPCLDPLKAPAPAAIDVKRSDPADVRCLTREVEQLVPCYAWTIKRTSKAFINLGVSCLFDPSIDKKF